MGAQGHCRHLRIRVHSRWESRNFGSISFEWRIELCVCFWYVDDVTDLHRGSRGWCDEGELFLGAEKSASYKPGDFGFDPLNLKNIRGDVKIMEENEIKNGRLAMLAISFYAFSEFFTTVPVVEQTPFLF